MGKRMIYLDNAATTPLDRDVLEAMLPYMTGEYGNASSAHAAGRRAAEAVSRSRDRIADILGCRPDEVYFTSGGTEADNWALKGIYGGNGGHIVLSAIEHPALLESAKDLEKAGAEVTYVRPGADGAVDPADIERAIRPDTVFVGVMHANNETGVIQPVKEISALCARYGVFFFSDCVQTCGVLPVDMSLFGGISLSAHKFHGPKGVGALCVRKGTRISRMMAGGSQERSMRAGTTNVAGIVGCAAALEKAVFSSAENNRKVYEMKDRFVSLVTGNIEGVHVIGAYGDADVRLPSNADLSFEGCDGDSILALLDMRGICVSTGSACAAGATEPSHVLTAMGLPEDTVRSSVRFTFGTENTDRDAEEAAAALREIIPCLRGAAQL